MKSLLCAFIILNLVGCATINSNSSKTEAKNAKIYDSDFQTVWRELECVLKNSEISIESIDENKGMIVSRRFQVSLEEFRRIGNLPERGDAGGFKQPWLWARYKQHCKVQAVSPNQTRVIVKTHLEGYNASGARWITIISNGAKEKEILDELQSRISQKKN